MTDLSNPDAELIRICAEHRAVADACNNTDSDDDPLWIAYCESRNAITNAEPQTIEGLLAKARLTELEVREPVGGMADTWAYGLVDDIIRLFGREG